MGRRKSNIARKVKHEEEENSERWLLTYADMITLLMAFFILMYTMSNISIAKMAALAAIMKNRLGGNISLFPGNDKADQNMVFKTEGEKGSKPMAGDARLIPQRFQVTMKDIKKTLKRNRLDDLVRVSTEKRGMVISIMSEGILFDLQSATLKPSAVLVLDSLGVILEKMANRISIEGNTDELRFSSGIDPAVNWNLSAARALSVLNYMVHKKRYISEKRVSMAAFAANKPGAVQIQDPEERRRMNRRVDIVIIGMEPEYIPGDITFSGAKKALDIGWGN